MELFLDILIDAALDTVKLIPFLFLTYLAMEYLEDRASEKTVALVSHTGKKGPLIGGLLGVVPQCGFSAAAANLYSGGVITVGTMIAVFLSTSDEMLPILISGRASFATIGWVLIAKVIYGVAAGIIVDVYARFRRHGKQKGLHIHDICEKDHCHCEDGSILKSAAIHSLQIILIIFVLNLVLNGIIEYVGMENIVHAISRFPVLSIFLTSLIGLIPNCAASVAITTCYLEGMLSAGCMFGGLLSCAGIGLVVLFKNNTNKKVNWVILAGLYGISVVGGLVVEAVSKLI